MGQKFWLGVARSGDLFKPNLKETWWCLPYGAEVGDRILLYCPRSESQSRQGVFAEAKVTVPPRQKREENCYCSLYGFRMGAGLGYTEIEIVERYTLKLTARDMKRDPILRKAPFVRRNFQGTTFALPEELYKRMKLRLREIVVAK